MNNELMVISSPPLPKRFSLLYHACNLHISSSCITLSFSYPYPTKWGRLVRTTCFHHVVIKIRHLFLRPAACLTSTLLETGVDACLP
jgi:hypothetical protein